MRFPKGSCICPARLLALLPWAAIAGNFYPGTSSNVVQGNLFGTDACATNIRATSP